MWGGELRIGGGGEAGVVVEVVVVVAAVDVAASTVVGGWWWWLGGGDARVSGQADDGIDRESRAQVRACLVVLVRAPPVRL